ncbi:hypothetical protein BIY24_01835 [Halobacteriovorax marinus]|uniref:hypothetical protein n=1 Tax=Halobacteriovorax marinus TaxID=97084 RepID=UPI000BC34BCE|nr:hypothetical protein [Halobacteriovorax marinus]ATH06721.1 hypothetical protein BIY24_01835 [Halobacteriovorax marinus]
MLDCKSNFKVIGAVNLVIFVVVLYLSYFFWKDAMAFSDGMNLYSAYPMTNAVKNEVTAGFLNYFKGWYVGMNGRFLPNFFGALVHELVVLFNIGPEEFPSWVLRGGSIFCNLMMPINILFAVLVMWGHELYLWLFTLMIIFLSYFFNAMIFTHLAFFDVLFFDRSLPMYLCSIFFLLILSDVRTKTVCIIGYFILAIFFSEQFLVSVSFIFIFIFFIRYGFSKMFIIHSIITFVIGVLNGLYFFLSPGQRWRQSLLDKTNKDIFSYRDWFVNFKVSNMDAWGNLFPTNLVQSVNYTILLLLLTTLIICVYCFFKKRRTILFFSSLSILFLIGFWLSMSSRMIYSYYPKYAIQYPLSLFTIFISLSVCSVLTLAREFPFLKGKRVRWCLGGLGVLFLSILLLGRSVVEFKKMRDAVVSVQETENLRKKIYLMIKKYSDEGNHSKYFVRDIPKSALDSYFYGTKTIEAPWSINAYLRWSRRYSPELRIFLDTHKGSDISIYKDWIQCSALTMKCSLK